MVVAVAMGIHRQWLILHKDIHRQWLILHNMGTLNRVATHLTVAILLQATPAVMEAAAITVGECGRC
jgi:hypothetical protein